MNIFTAAVTRDPTFALLLDPPLFALSSKLFSAGNEPFSVGKERAHVEKEIRDAVGCTFQPQQNVSLTYSRVGISYR